MNSIIMVSGSIIPPPVGAYVPMGYFAGKIAINR